MKFFIITLILVSIFSMKFLRKIFNPISVMNILWGLILYLSSLNLYNLFPTPRETYNWIFIGLISYNIGFFIIYFFKWSLFRTSAKKTDTFIRYEIRENLILVLGIISIFFLIPPAITSLQIIMKGGGTDVIRVMNQQGVGVFRLKNSSDVLNSINVLLIQPFNYLISIIGFVNFWSDKRSKKVLFITTIIVLLSVLGTGGRALLINSTFSFIISFFFKNKKLQISKKTKNIILFSLIILFTFIVLISISRSSGDFVQITYYYFAMVPYMFSYWGKIIVGITGYGMASMNGFLFPIFYILKHTLGLDFPEKFQQVYTLIQSTDSTWITMTATGSNANAYVSVFWFLLLDGGLIGIIFGMGILGGVLSHSFFNVVNNISEKSIAIYSYLLIGISYSFVRLPFGTPNYSIGFIFILFFIYKKRRLKL